MVMAAIATVSCLIAHLVIIDGLELMTTFSDFAITRRGPPATLAATGAGGEERYVGRAFGDAGEAPRAPHCARIVSIYLNVESAPPYSHGDSPRPRC